MSAVRSIRSAATCGGDVGERAAQDALLGRACLHHNGGRAVGAVERGQFLDDRFDGVDREMDDERRTARGKCRQLFRSGIREARPQTRVSTTLCATSGTVSSQSKRGGGGRESRHAGRERIRDAAPGEAAKLFGERRVDRQIAGMKPRHIVAGGVRRDELGFDLVERQRRGIDDAGARRAKAKQIRAARSSRHRDRPGSARSDRGRAQ